MDPCKTPELATHEREWVPFIRKNACLLIKHLRNRLAQQEETQKLTNLKGRKLWGTALKALLKSKYTSQLDLVYSQRAQQ